MDTMDGTFDPLGDPKDGHILTRAIIDTIHEPLIVLDEKLRVVAASHSFYHKFNLTSKKTLGEMFYDIGDGQWNIPALRTLLKKVIPKHAIVKGYEVEHTSPFFGLRIMTINAREIRFDNGRKKMLLSIFDVTTQRKLETDREKLLAQKDVLLKEMRHRIANSLQLIASILLLKAETVDSKESRTHLEDAHQRILSIATVQRQLDPVDVGIDIKVSQYLEALCKSLARSMIGGRKPITVKVISSKGTVSSDMAISFGLIITELVINAIKHAFPNGKKGKIVVTYERKGSAWVLSVEDNGIGHPETKKIGRTGLGTSIIGALANQLHASIRTKSSVDGTKVSLTHAGT